MSDSLFGDLDVASAADNPYEVPAGAYPTVVTSVEVGPSKDGTKTILKLVRTIVEGASTGLTLTTWHQIPRTLSPAEFEALDTEGQAAHKKALSYLKREMLTLGIPESRINSIKSDDLLDLPSVLTVSYKAGSTFPTIYSRAAKPGEVNASGGVAGLSQSSGSNPFDD